MNYSIVVSNYNMVLSDSAVTEDMNPYLSTCDRLIQPSLLTFLLAFPLDSDDPQHKLFFLPTSIFIYLLKLGGPRTLVEISLIEEVNSSHLIHVESSGFLSFSLSCFGEGGCFFLVCKLGTMYPSCLGVSFSTLDSHIESPCVPHPLLFDCHLEREMERKRKRVK